MKQLVYLAAGLIVHGFSYADGNYVVNKDHVLYKSKTPHVRAFLEPGTILKKVHVAPEDTYKRRVRVITNGGLRGEVVRNGYNNYDVITQPVAYLKRPLTLANEQFESGDTFLVKVLDDEDGLRYEVTYPKPFLSLKDNRFYVRDRKKTMNEREFDYNFNLVTPDSNITKFPLWKTKNDQFVEWGCENSKKEVSTFEIGAGGEVKASTSFFSFFEADAHVTNDNTKTVTYTKELVDNENLHKLTYWQLVDSSNPNTIILNLALEKLSACDKTKKSEYNYVIHFPTNDNINYITINRAWVKGKGLKEGGASPLGMNTLDDYRTFKAAFKDFNFQYSYPGFDVNAAILQYVMKIAANVSVEYED